MVIGASFRFIRVRTRFGTCSLNLNPTRSLELLIKGFSSMNNFLGYVDLILERLEIQTELI
jgi:hypothetical protein